MWLGRTSCWANIDRAAQSCSALRGLRYLGALPAGSSACRAAASTCWWWFPAARASNASTSIHQGRRPGLSTGLVTRSGHQSIEPGVPAPTAALSTGPGHCLTSLPAHQRQIALMPVQIAFSFFFWLSLSLSVWFLPDRPYVPARPFPCGQPLPISYACKEIKPDSWGPRGKLAVKQ